MKQNITISVAKSLLRKARALAAQRGASISALLAQELLKIADRDTGYELSKRRALSGGRWRASPRHFTSAVGSELRGTPCTIVKTFVDSNILIYAHDSDADRSSALRRIALRNSDSPEPGC